MENLTIQISWEYFLGIMFALMGVAWYSNGRFTALETSMNWVKDILKDLKIGADNATTPAFANHSPVNLTPTGENWLVESGLKKYIDDNKDVLLKDCVGTKDTNPYEVQKYTFKKFDEINFEPVLEDKLKKFSFEKGTSMIVIRRVGGIYLRNLCLEKFKMNREEIDKHDPEKQPKNE